MSVPSFVASNPPAVSFQEWPGDSMRGGVPQCPVAHIQDCKGGARLPPVGLATGIWPWACVPPLARMPRATGPVSASHGKAERRHCLFCARLMLRRRTAAKALARGAPAARKASEQGPGATYRARGGIALSPRRLQQCIGGARVPCAICPMH